MVIMLHSRGSFSLKVCFILRHLGVNCSGHLSCNLSWTGSVYYPSDCNSSEPSALLTGGERVLPYPLSIPFGEASIVLHLSQAW